MVHLPNHWVSLRSTSTKGKQTLYFSWSTTSFHPELSTSYPCGCNQNKIRAGSKAGRREGSVPALHCCLEAAEHQGQWWSGTKEAQTSPFRGCKAHPPHWIGMAGASLQASELPRQRKHLQVVINIHTGAWHKKKKTPKQAGRWKEQLVKELDIREKRCLYLLRDTITQTAACDSQTPRV